MRRRKCEGRRPRMRHFRITGPSTRSNKQNPLAFMQVARQDRHKWQCRHGGRTSVFTYAPSPRTRTGGLLMHDMTKRFGMAAAVLAGRGYAWRRKRATASESFQPPNSPEIGAVYHAHQVRRVDAAGI